MLLALLENNFLRFFIDNIEPDNWQDTASSWIYTALVVAVLAAGVMLGIKALRKSMQGIAERKIWTRGQTWLFILVGIFPVFLVLFAVWYFTRDFLNFIEVGGLLKGTLFAWVIYTVLMAVGHLVGPWRKELI